MDFHGILDKSSYDTVSLIRANRQKDRQTWKLKGRSKRQQSAKGAMLRFMGAGESATSLGFGSCGGLVVFRSPK